MKTLSALVRMVSRPAIAAWLVAAGTLQAADPDASTPTSTPDTDAVRRLATEVHDLGWVVYSARSDKGDWDLFACRPDGTGVRPLTRTPEFSEFSPLLSRDGRRLLYRRILPQEKLDNNRHGEQGEAVVANSDGSDPRPLGKPGEVPWATWSPDGTQISSLSIKGISFIDLASGRVIRTLPRKGFFQQLTWSPDGRSLIGVANSYGTGWSVARMDVATGEAAAVNRVDCCTPDWFPDSSQVIFSWRPRGQKANKGYGWTQLWRTDFEGRSPKLVYGEDGRHVYGGRVSPDGKYVLFTGNMHEDGDPGNSGAPMGLMRLADGPIIGGESAELRSVHPQAHNGPVLVLPAGWEPDWTERDLFAAQSPRSDAAPVRSGALAPAVAELAAEVHEQGWIAFSAVTDSGDWDLFAFRPDGSDRRSLTDTRQFNEAGARFSPDGRHLLYYRLPRSESVDNNTYGTFELVLANADGSEPVVFGAGYTWASWNTDGSQFVTLSAKSIQIVEVATRKVLRQLPRQGLVSQLGWSPDGSRLVGTANGLGPFWCIGCLDIAAGQLKAVSETDRYNCTPDWTPDGKHILYARGIIPQQGGRAELWEANVDGSAPRPLYAEAGRHIYGAGSSPDGKYLLFTRSIEDLGKVDHSGTTIAIVRRTDTPMAGDEAVAATEAWSKARRGPRLDLGRGWEPAWTRALLGPSHTAVRR